MKMPTRKVNRDRQAETLAKLFRSDDWRAAAWWLALAHPREWGPTGPGDLQELLDELDSQAGK